jgi:excisionase family DNA binding protein
MSKTKEEWLTTKQVAQMLGCGVANIQRLLRSNFLRGKKILDRWLVARSSVEAYLAHPPKPGPKPKKDKSK